MSDEAGSTSGIVLEGVDDVVDYVWVSTSSTSEDCLDAEKCRKRE